MNLLLVVAVLLALIFVLAALSHGATSRPSKQRHAGLAAAATVSISLFAAQVLASFKAFSVQWLSPVNELVGALDNVFSAGGGSRILQLSCILAVASDSERHLLSLAVLPLVMLLALLVAAARNRRTSVAHFRAECEYTLGTLGLVLFIAISGTTVKPFVVFHHVCGGRASLVAYPNIFVGSVEHIPLILCSVIIALCIPLPFVVACCWAVWQAPGRLARGDSAFFLSHRFLFGKFRHQNHGYALVVLARNFLVSMAPMVGRDNAAGQILMVMVVLALHLSLLTKLQPWRVRGINDLEAYTLILLLLVLAVGAVLTEPKSMVVLTIISSVLLGALSIMIVAFLVAAAKRAMRPQPVFAFFLCKDNAAGGRALSRAMHLKLARFANPCKTFVDEDHFLSADERFDVIRSSARNFVVLLTRGTLYSPGCAAEITVAVQNEVPMIVVRCPGFDPQGCLPGDMRSILDFTTTGLAQHGLQPKDVLRAYAEILGADSIVVDKRLGTLEFDALASHIVAKAVGVEQHEDVAPAPRRSSCPKGRFAVLSHAEDSEGSLGAIILHELLLPHLGDCCFLQVDPGAPPFAYEEVLKYMTAPRFAEGACHGVAVLLSQAGLRLPEAVGLIRVVARRCRLHDLGVVLVALPQFVPPGEQFYQHELPGLLRELQQSTEGGEEELRFLFGLSRVHLDTHGTERMLRAQAEEVSRLLQSDKPAFGEGLPLVPGGVPVEDSLCPQAACPYSSSTASQLDCVSPPIIESVHEGMPRCFADSLTGDSHVVTAVL